ncbi:glycosyltransferase family 4 protein [Mycobacterium asiaticum]|uniref:Glycosyl transferase family 1 n=1 Tax=Mycobacterium asiaticum TaxID=1790 RepID=A0A1A3MU82_MYCAS|nr:glycosyltransferase family 4 protein [Mycobacterium asiaticum]OBK13483.1 glycosyl transferase family 1 [Mycobacterium asiaticum]
MTNPLRVAVIASNRFPIREPFAGGLEAHVSHLSRALASRGHQVSLFAAPGSDLAPGCQSLSVRPLALSEPARRDVSMPAPEFMADHHAYLSLMLWLAGPGGAQYDVIHNHSLHYLPVAMAPALSVPMLTTVHTPPTPWLESAIDASAGNSTRFSAVSRHTARAWQTVIADISVVPNGVDTALWPLGPGGPCLVWFGRITPEKAPHLAIAAARQADRPLLLAGPISDERYFADRVAPELHGGIRYVGHLDHQQLASLVGESGTALVTPAWDEPYGLVVAEAMSCGTPVVAFARGGIPELINDDSGRLVAPGDTTAMVAAIESTIRLSRNRVREHAIRHCSSTAMVNAYSELYREMIDDVTGRTNDRLLHPSPRLRSFGAGHQCLRPDATPGDGVDFVEYPSLAPVFGNRPVAT